MILYKLYNLITSKLQTHLYSLENVEQVIPYHLYGGDEQTLVGRVNAAQRRTEAYHVELGIFLREETTFQSGVDSQNLGLFAEETLVAFLGNLYDFAVRIEFPSRIAFVGHD